ncbi:PD40 domain-containing protein [bacterium]|nr:PD40 domain-containing protein [bacterium]
MPSGFFLPRGILVVALPALFLSYGCQSEDDPSEPTPAPTRAESIPASAVKQTPESDLFPPVIHSADWEDPVPLSGPVNTAGAEDAPVISSDGNTFLFFFTPDVSIPPEQQLLDQVTGIWWSRREGGEWTEPVRVKFTEELSLEGPFALEADTLWYGAIRAGNYLSDGDIFLAELRGNEWTNSRSAGERLNLQYNIGELYTSGDGNMMIFGRPDTMGFGGYDLWETVWNGSEWSEPENLGATVNTAANESHPYLSADGNELWFNSDSRMGYTGPALYRTLRTDSGWTAPVEMVSNFAGDPGLDAPGNIYFTHHFFDSGLNMIEADVYVARKR